MNHSHNMMNVSLRVKAKVPVPPEAAAKMETSKRFSDISESDRTAVTAATTDCSSSSFTTRARLIDNDAAEGEQEDDYEEASVLELIHREDEDSDDNLERPQRPTQAARLVDYSSSRASLGRASSYRVKRISKRSTERVLGEPEPETRRQERRLSALKKHNINQEANNTEQEEMQVDEEVGSIAFYCRRLGMVLDDDVPRSPSSPSNSIRSNPQERLRFAMKRHSSSPTTTTSTNTQRRRCPKLPPKSRSLDTGRALLSSVTREQNKDSCPRLPIRSSSRRELVSLLLEKSANQAKAAGVATTRHETLLGGLQKRSSASTATASIQMKKPCGFEEAAPAAAAPAKPTASIQMKKPYAAPAATAAAAAAAAAARSPWTIGNDDDLKPNPVPQEVPTQIVVPTMSSSCPQQRAPLRPTVSSCANGSEKKPGRVVAAQLDVASLAAEEAEKGVEDAMNSSQRHRGSLSRGMSLKKIANGSLRQIPILRHLKRKNKNFKTTSMYSQLNEPEEQEEDELQDLSQKLSQSLPSILFVPGGQGNKACLDDDDNSSTCSTLSMDDDLSRLSDEEEEQEEREEESATDELQFSNISHNMAGRARMSRSGRRGKRRTKVNSASRCSGRSSSRRIGSGREVGSDGGSGRTKHQLHTHANANDNNKSGGVPVPVAIFPTRIRRVGVANPQA